MSKTIIVLITLPIACFLVAVLLDIGWQAVERGEVIDCEKWQQQAEDARQGERNLFYLEKWQADQCEAHGIVINAPIRD